MIAHARKPHTAHAFTRNHHNNNNDYMDGGGGCVGGKRGDLNGVCTLCYADLYTSGLIVAQMS